MDMGIRRTLACAVALAAATLTLTTPTASEAVAARTTSVVAAAPAAPAAPAPAKLQWTDQVPQLTGPKRVGTRLHVKFAFKTGFSPKAQRLYFQWRRWNKPIKGAAGPDHRNYRVKKRDRNANISVVVFGYRDGYQRGLIKSNIVKIART